MTFELTKSVDNSTPELNQLFTYTLFYRCASLTETHCNDMVITDQLAAELEFVTAAAGAHPATVTESGNLVTFAFDQPVPAGSTGQVAITVRIPLWSGVNSGDTISNTATIDASNASAPLDSNPVNVTATIGSDPAYYNKYALSASAALDLDYEYQMAVEPTSAPVTNLTIVDTLPTGSIYVSCSGGDSCSYDSSNHTVTWTQASVTSWDAFNVTIRFPSSTFNEGDTVSNTADFTFTDGSTSVNVSDTDSTTIEPPTPVIKTEKWGFVATDIWGSSDVEIGEEAAYPFRIDNDGTEELTNVVLTDIFPAEFDFTLIRTPLFNSPYPTGMILYYELNSSGTWIPFPASAYDNGSGADPANNEDVTRAELGISSSDRVSGLRVELATLPVGVGTGQGSHGKIHGTINTNAIGSPTVENCVSVTTDNGASDSHCDVVNILSIDVAALDSYKWVKGLDDLGFVNPINSDPCEDNGQGYTRYPCVAQTVQGGIADYQLVLENPGTITMTDIILIDILPHIGDTGVLVSDPRNTEWTPNLAGPVTAPSGVTVFYSTSTNPCRGEVDGPTTGCDAPNWTTTPPTDITTVGSLKFDFGTIEIAPGEQFILTWPMRVPNGTPIDEIAWNSFAYVTSRADNGVQLLASEPPKVGIITKADLPNTYGDYIWVDANRDGIQDSGEVGLNGVQIDLYQDVNNTPADFTDDLHVGFTVSGDDDLGNPGYYLFPNLPDGHYYAVATPPTIYGISPVDASGDGGANDTADAEDDSDFDPNTLRTPITELGPRDVVLIEEVDLSWDLGLYELGPSILIEKTVYEGHDSGASCPGIELVQAAIGANITYCFVITNNGETDLDDITFSDPTLGITGADVVSPIITTTVLPQGVSMTVYYEAASLGTITNTATVDARPIDSNGDPILDPETGNPIDRPTDDDTAATEEGPAMVMIGDFVWIEDDNDGDATTGIITPVVGSLVTAIASDGTVYTDTTDSNGLYTITVPANATYTVTVAIPSGLLPSGTLITSDSDPNSDNNLSHDGNGTVVTVGAEDNLTIDFGFYEPLIAASHIPNCPAGALLWVNNIDVNTLEGVHGIPVVDVRLVRNVNNNAVSYTLPITLPAAFSGPIDINISEAVAWDGYLSRPSSSNQPDERYAVLFKKNGNVEWQSPWTGVDGTDDGIAEGVTFDDWTGSLGTASLPNGADEIILIHWSEPTYGGGSDTGTNSVVPCSICIEYSIPDVLIGDRVWIEDDNDGDATTGNITAVVGITVTATASDGTIYTDVTDASGNYTISVPANAVYTLTVSTPVGTTPAGTLITADSDPNTQNDLSHDGSGTTVTVGTEDNLTIDFGFYAEPPATIAVIKYTTGDDGTFTFSSLDPDLDTLSITTVANMGVSSVITKSAGNYTITEDSLAGWNLTAITVTESLINNSSAMLGDSLANLVVEAGEHITITFQNELMATDLITVGNYVWVDADMDGIQDSGEPVLSGVQVELRTITGTLVATTTTDANGLYTFTDADGMAPSTSYLIVIPDDDPVLNAGGYTATMPDQGNDDDTDSDTVYLGDKGGMDWVTDGTSPFDHAIEIISPASGANLTYDFGFTGTIEHDCNSDSTITIQSIGLGGAYASHAYTYTIPNPGNVIGVIAEAAWRVHFDGTILPTEVTFTGSNGITATVSGGKLLEPIAYNNDPSRYNTTLYRAYLAGNMSSVTLTTPMDDSGDPFAFNLYVIRSSGGEDQASNLFFIDKFTGSVDNDLPQNATTIAPLASSSIDSDYTFLAPIGDAGTAGAEINLSAGGVDNSGSDLYPEPNPNPYGSDVYLQEMLLTGVPANTSSLTVYQSEAPSSSSSFILTGVMATAESCHEDVLIGDRVWIEDDNDGLATTGVITPVIGSVVTAIASDGTVYTDTTDAMGYYTITVPANDVYTVTVSTPAGTVAAVPIGGLITTDNDPNTNDDTSHDPAGTVVTVGTTDNLTIDFGFFEPMLSLALSKTLNTPEPVTVGQPVSYTIRITNTGNVTITTLPLSDTYDTTYLSYNSLVGSTPATDDNADDGQLDWSDLTVTEGDLGPGAVIEVVTHFTANADTSALATQAPCVNSGESCNVATVNGAMADAEPVPTITDSDDVAIEELVTGKSTLGDFVWFDTNSDGIKDPGEPGINGVIINLYDSSGFVTTTVTMSDTNGIGDDTGATNGDGFYDFEVLPSTVYTVEIDLSNFAPGGALEGYTYTGNNATQLYNGDETRVVGMPPVQHDENNVDFGYFAPALFELSKTLNTPSPVRVGEKISFTIRITNTGSVVMTTVPLTDTYNNAYMSYTTVASPEPDISNVGELVWSDLTSSGTAGFGIDLNPGETFAVTVEFVTNIDTTGLPNDSTINLATSQGITDTEEVQAFSPTSIEFTLREVTYENENVMVHWETADESDVVGFHIYRAVVGDNGLESEGEPIKLTPEVMIAEKSGSPLGASYTYEDESAEASVDYRYFVGILDTNGFETQQVLGNVTTRRTIDEWFIFLPITLK